MSEYLEYRDGLIEQLEYLTHVRGEYLRLCRNMESCLGRSSEIWEFLKAQLPRLQEMMVSIKDDVYLRAIIGGETRLLKQWEEAQTFWAWLSTQRASLELPDPPNETPVKTGVPPIPPEPVSSETLLVYMREFRDWVVASAEDLWGEKNPLEIPKLPDRYLIGDYRHMGHVVSKIEEGAKIRQLWCELATSERMWNSVSVGSSRSRLLHVSVQMLQCLLNHG